MKLEICYKKKIDPLFLYTINLFPERIRTSLLTFYNTSRFNSINEIRIRASSKISLIADLKNIKTDIVVTAVEIEEIFNSLCNYSVYAHFNTIKQGYISLGKGIRAGVCGKASLEDGILIGISSISSINIRIPHQINGVSSFMFNFLSENDFSCSILLYSPPGVGKTTVLRDLIYKMSNDLRRIRFSVIDTREEITSAIEGEISADVFLGYPKGLGIELATKSMTPEYIICDEISSESEAISILKASHSGVKLIATTHSSTYEELISKEILKPLLSERVFDYAIGLERKNGQKALSYTIQEL